MQSRPRRVVRTHSGFGIASFVLSIAAILLILAGIAYAAVKMADNPDLENDEAEVMFVGAFVVLGLLTSFIGGALGIAGVCEADKKKTFSVVGLVLNCLVFFPLVLMMCIM